MPNLALNPVRFALWTLHDKAAQRRLALRSPALRSDEQRSAATLCADYNLMHRKKENIDYNGYLENN